MADGNKKTDSQSESRSELPKSQGRRLRELRKSKGLSQEALAKEISNLQEQKTGEDGTCSDKQISYIESAKRPISARYADLFAEFFEVDADYILCKSDYRNIREKLMSELQTSSEEGNLLYTGICAFATLCGYTISTIPTTGGNIEEVIKKIKKTYTIEKDGKKLYLSLAEMNLFENELCDMFETRIKYLFKEKGGK